ncbi:hypothetical protein CDAR_56391 [Caerostris darwini]|uniref:Uncharacterized protein n=1 Tax=Caerostris darwini TaxID=1538125 RepID=A0AAV4WKC1_9ARAC|nr:hypothetical protein CDAR_56391 [Caerostris darwini]
MGFRASRFASPDEALTHLKNVSSVPLRQSFRERGRSLFKIQELGFFRSKRNSEVRMKYGCRKITWKINKKIYGWVTITFVLVLLQQNIYVREEILEAVFT